MSVPSPRALTRTILSDLDHLPRTGIELFGRDDELDRLDQALAAPGTHAVALIAWGGVGKSTLVNRWLEGVRAGGWGRITRAYGWSFYSQGTGERVSSADRFIREALAWFGDPDPAQGSDWARGERLAGLVQQQPTLLVLDGLEPLQREGRISDPALQVLVGDLARHNPGLMVITSRVRVADLDDEPGHTLTIDLQQLSPAAGRALLRVDDAPRRGLRGTDAELEALSAAFGHQAFALTLVKSWLQAIPERPARAALGLPDLPEVSVAQGKHARRVLAAFAARLGEGPEVELLRLLSLFDRPAEAAAVAAVRRAPGIEGLTGSIVAAASAAAPTPTLPRKRGREETDDTRPNPPFETENPPPPLAGEGRGGGQAALTGPATPPLSEADWLRLIERLRAAGLIAKASHHAPDQLDTHPLVREHFAADLKARHPAAWRAGHARLFEHYQQVPEKDLPDTLEEMYPLFLAVSHGCAAGEYQGACDEVYSRRIQRGREDYNWKKLGGIGLELAAVAGFFDPPFTTPVAALPESDRAWLLNQAALDLRALGRLPEAVAPMRANLEMRIARNEWRHAPSSASNLSQLLLAVGEVADAMAAGRQGVAFADRTEDLFQRMVNRTTLADALHQTGETDEAAALFAEAETIQQQDQPQYPRLYSLQGYRYCDLLLSQGHGPEVRERAQYALEVAQRNNWLLAIALDTLTLGRAVAAGNDRDAATHWLDAAVDGLRKAGQVDHLPRGLLARAAFRRETGDFARAQRDLDEVVALSKRCGMRLFLADARLEGARLALARKQPEAARQREAARLLWEEVRDLVAATGYHRQDGEVAALEGQLL